MRSPPVLTEVHVQSSDDVVYLTPSRTLPLSASRKATSALFSPSVRFRHPPVPEAGVTVVWSFCGVCLSIGIPFLGSGKGHQIGYIPVQPDSLEKEALWSGSCCALRADEA